MKQRRLAAKAPLRKKAPARRVALKKAAPAEVITPEEAAHLEDLAQRFEAGEKAWQRMTAPVEDDPWTKVEEHLLERGRAEGDRRWKFFSK
jgi:hypothetical protein